MTGWILDRASRFRLALAIFFGGEIVAHMRSFDALVMRSGDEKDFAVDLNEEPRPNGAVSSKYWVVERQYTVWIPKMIGGRICIAPCHFGADDKKWLTVVRW